MEPPDKDLTCHKSTEGATTPQIVVAQLVLLTGGAAGQVIKVEQAVTSIGRHPDNTIVLPSQMVSRQHAEIVKQDDQFFVQDLGSRNGILLNYRRLASNARALLHHRDEIVLSDHRLLFLACKAEEALEIASIHLDESKIRADADEAIQRFLNPPTPDS